MLPTPRAESAGASPTKILDADWSAHYGSCAAWQAVWEQTHDPTSDWPADYKLVRAKLYYQERLCVPEALRQRVLEEYHAVMGHLGPERLALDARRQFEFPPGTDPLVILRRVKRECMVCQASERPLAPSQGPIAMTAIPERFFSSVSIDVFQLPIAEWRGSHYDAFLMCVDRHSGWMVARPTQYAGMTGEKAAHLLLDSCWGEVGVPSVITSDRGAQFANQWWLTMCGRLGVRVAFSQIYRPQSNGRAEVAGRVVMDVLRKVLLVGNYSWVEVLPRVLRVLHDTPDPATKMTPYEVVFGRPRAMAGLPWTPQQASDDAEAHFSRMADIDKMVAEMVNATHRRQADEINKRRRARPEYTPGEWVWYRRPLSITGAKLRSWWLGPFKLVERMGAQSYMLRTPQGETIEAHADQIKKCFWPEPEELEGEVTYPAVQEEDESPPEAE